MQTIQSIPRAKMFSALGVRSQFQPLINQAVSAGATAMEVPDSGTIVVHWNDQTLIRALRKGDESQPWIVTYNTDFFPRPGRR